MWFYIIIGVLFIAIGLAVHVFKNFLMPYSGKKAMLLKALLVDDVFIMVVF